MAVSLPRIHARTLPVPSAGALSFLLLNAVGVLAYLYPFVSADATRTDSRWFEHGASGPLLFAAVASLCMLLCVSELTNGRLSSKSLAVLAVLAAMAGALRMISLPAGANLYFFLVILAGYAFGPRMGFLTGAMSFFFSAVVTGGIGPWLPFQMFASAWMGLTAGLLRPLALKAGFRGRGEVGLIVLFGVVWGVLFGAITNLWFWPFWPGGPDISYEPGLGVAETVRRYWNFYLLTSLGWDLLRSACNAVILIAVGGPLLRALTRFRDRVEWEPVVPPPLAAELPVDSRP